MNPHLRHSRYQGRRRAIVSTVLAGIVILAAAPPAAAIVLSEPAPTPSPMPPQMGGRVEVPWAGLAMTFPTDWDVRVKRPPGRVNDGGATILFARGPDDAKCMLDQYDPATVENWEDVGIEAVAALSIAGLSAKRYDDMWGGGAVGVSAYTVHTPAFQYSLLCTAPIAPDDRWHSIASSLELLPPGDPA